MMEHPDFCLDVSLCLQHNIKAILRSKWKNSGYKWQSYVKSYKNSCLEAITSCRSLWKNLVFRQWHVAEFSSSKGKIHRCILCTKTECFTTYSRFPYIFICLVFLFMALEVPPLFEEKIVIWGFLKDSESIVLLWIMQTIIKGS